MTTVSVTHESRPFNLDVGKTRRVNAKVTTATAYKEGDLLALSAANVLTQAADESNWDVICGATLTAEQATAAAANGTEIPVYNGGVFNIEAVSIAGTALESSKYAATSVSPAKNSQIPKLVR